MKLKELLSEIPIEIETACVLGKEQKVGQFTVRTLAEFVEVGAKEPAPPWYVGAKALIAPPRHIADLWFRLKALVDAQTTDTKAGADALIGALAKEVRLIIQEDHHLTGKGREAFLNTLIEDAEDQWELAPDVLTARWRSTAGVEIDVTVEGGHGGHQGGKADVEADRIALRLPHVREWYLRPADDAAAKASNRTEASLVLLHDLLALRKDAGIIGPGLAPVAFEIDWASVVWGFGPDRDVQVTWPTPNWNSFWEFDLLRAGWKRAREYDLAKDQNTALARAAYLWIETITSILDAKPIRPPNPGTHAKSPSAKNWKDVAFRISALWKNRREGTNARRDRIESWVVALACLLAPETGLPKGIADHFVGPCVSAWEDPAIGRQVRFRRAQRLASFGAVGAWLYVRGLSVTWQRHFLDLLVEGETQEDWERTLNSRMDPEEWTAPFPASAPFHAFHAVPPSALPKGLRGWSAGAQASSWYKTAQNWYDHKISTFKSGNVLGHLVPGPPEAQAFWYEVDRIEMANRTGRHTRPAAGRAER